ncbi:DUF2189 domain-containing protein [Niveispirillum sp.]|uniref:DUF2189 domain-containing protein n=1 Tax=Niveispirillum sp. TaxID=1917217 RepID=UPI001B5F41BF|nr:DUF2189 domain-containing protein [Niveispirillum sp.]MBP7340074.1 DUF2189 domain-containing protein [Niveispirillum sp.]
MAYRMAANQTAATRDGSIMMPEIRRISVHDLMEALSMGVRDFMAAPTQLLFLGLIYPLVGGLAAAAAAQNDLVPLLYPALAGLSIMGPVAALGMYELSRQREMGVPVTWRNALDVRHSGALLPIAWLGVLLLGAFIVWLAVAEHIYAATLAAQPHGTLSEFMSSLLGSREGWMMIVIGNGVGFLFAMLVLTLTVVSFPMMLDRQVGVLDAVITSARAVLRNPVILSVWGLMVVGLLLLGSLPLFVGLAVVMPVLGHATWHLYRKLVV